jgi:hypothetical protein
VSDERIDPQVIEAAAKAMYAALGTARQRSWEVLTIRQREPMLREAEAAIRAADRERGIEKESRPNGLMSRGTDEPLERYISDWRPVERGSEDV